MRQWGPVGPNNPPSPGFGAELNDENYGVNKLECYLMHMVEVNERLETVQLKMEEVITDEGPPKKSITFIFTDELETS